jgi:hypothetical protein
MVLSEGVGLTPGSGGVMEEEWFYCLDHRTVEPVDGCRAAVRIGPFPTREEAAMALETVERRNREWDNDPEWSED